MKQYTVTRSIRALFIDYKANQLTDTNVWISPGATIEVGPEEVCSYKHMTTKAHPIMIKGEKFYILARTLDPNFWLCSVVLIQSENAQTAG